MFHCAALSRPFFRPSPQPGFTRGPVSLYMTAGKQTANGRGDAVKCGNCGNDLMLGIVLRGPARLLHMLPLAPYRCVRCGKSNWRLSVSYGALGSRLALGLLGLVALVLAYWLGATLGLPGADPAPGVVTMAALPPAPQESAPPAPPEAPAPSGAEAPLQAAAAPGDPAGASPVQAGAPLAAAPQDAQAPLDEEAPLDIVPRPLKAEPRPAEAAKPAAGGPLRIRDLTVRTSGGAVVVTARASAALAATRAFTLENPPRFVVDIPGQWTPDSARSVKTAAKGLRGVRTGLRDGALRLVLDLERKPAKGPQVARKGDTLTITLR